MNVYIKFFLIVCVINSIRMTYTILLLRWKLWRWKRDTNPWLTEGRKIENDIDRYIVIILQSSYLAINIKILLNKF